MDLGLSAPPGALLRAALLAALLYAYLVALLRVAGNRTLGKLRAFDFVVTIAIGSLVASTVLGPASSFLEGAVAITVLVALQGALAWVTARSPAALRLVTAPPILLFHHGDFVRGNLRKARVAEREVRGAMRRAGYTRERDVGAVVLEPTGELSVLPRGDGGLAVDEVPGLGGRRDV